MSDSRLNSWAHRALTEHPALIVSGLYLVASLIGLVYSWFFLRGFSINAFRYMEISDFLLASLKEPFTWALVALAVVLILFDNTMSLRVQRRGPGRLWRWYGSKWYRYVNYLGSVFLVVVFLWTFATVKERGIRNGGGEIVTVHLTEGSPAKQRVLLGTSGKFVFLYDRAAERVYIHPHESILMITKSAPNLRKRR